MEFIQDGYYIDLDLPDIYEKKAIGPFSSREDAYNFSDEYVNKGFRPYVMCYRPEFARILSPEEYLKQSFFDNERH